MCYSFATFCDLLAGCEYGAVTESVVTAIVLRCMPHIERATIDNILADMPPVKKSLEMQLFAVFVVSKAFDSTAAFPLLESAKYARSMILNNASLWTEAQQRRHGALSLTDFFFRCIMLNADVHIFLRHVPEVQLLVKHQFHYYIFNKAQKLNNFLSSTSDSVVEEGHAAEEIDDSFFPFDCKSVAHFKTLHKQSFFKSAEESNLFLFHTIPMLQALSTADKTSIVNIFI